MKDRLQFRAWMPDAEHSKSDMFYQEGQYLSSFLQRIYNAYGVTHPSYLPFELEDRLTQSTGLKDKNGKLIFEGDIIKCDKYPFVSEGELNYVGEVYYCQIDAFVAVELHVVSDRVSGRAIGGALCEYEDCEIIGNKFENPELIEVKDD